MDFGEMIEIYPEMFRQAVKDAGFNMRGVVALMASYNVNVNEDYLTKRVGKGSVPIKAFKAACKVIGVDYHDFAVEYDLSDVPTYQLEEEIESRKG